MSLKQVWIAVCVLDYDEGQLNLLSHYAAVFVGFAQIQ